MEPFFVRLAQVRQLPRVLALGVLLLGLPFLAIGLQSDDWLIAQRVHDHPLDAFVFFPGGRITADLRARGILSWPVSPDAKLQLLRPLASLSHALDFALWPEAAWLMHLENLLLYAALVWTAAKVFAEVLGTGVASRLAAIFYALSPGHATSVGWIASRNTLICAWLGLLSVWLCLRARSWRSPAAAAAVCVHALALLAGEAALAVLAPVMAYALTLAAGSRSARALRVAPHLILCVGYLFVYAKLGYGSADIGAYLNVWQQPWAVAQNVLLAVPLYLASQLLVPYAGLASVLTSGTWLLALTSCLILLACVPWVMPVLRSDARARFFAWSALGSIAPFSAAVPQDRLGFWMALGGCGLLSLYVTADGRGARALFHMHTSAALLSFVPMGFLCLGPLVGGAPHALNAALVAPEGRDVVVLNVPVETTVASVWAMRQQLGAAAARSLRALYVGGAAYEVRRVDERTLDLYVERGWFSNTLERLGRDPRAAPFAPGDMETTDAFSARIVEVDSLGAPRRVRFQLRQSLDDPRWLWLRLDGSRALPWTPPRIGEAQQLSACGLLW